MFDQVVERIQKAADQRPVIFSAVLPLRRWRMRLISAFDERTIILLTAPADELVRRSTTTPPRQHSPSLSARRPPQPSARPLSPRRTPSMSGVLDNSATPAPLRHYAPAPPHAATPASSSTATATLSPRAATAASSYSDSVKHNAPAAFVPFAGSSSSPSVASTPSQPRVNVTLAESGDDELTSGHDESPAPSPSPARRSKEAELLSFEALAMLGCVDDIAAPYERVGSSSDDDDDDDTDDDDDDDDKHFVPSEHVYDSLLTPRDALARNKAVSYAAGSSKRHGSTISSLSLSLSFVHSFSPRLAVAFDDSVVAQSSSSATSAASLLAKSSSPPPNKLDDADKAKAAPKKKKVAAPSNMLVRRLVWSRRCRSESRPDDSA